MFDSSLKVKVILLSWWRERRSRWRRSGGRSEQLEERLGSPSRGREFLRGPSAQWLVERDREMTVAAINVKPPSHLANMITELAIGLRLLIIVQLSGAWSQPINSPPILHVERKWIIPDTEPIDSVVTKARGDDLEGDQLEFGLEQVQTYNLNIGHSGPLPFTIDSRTGVVRTNQSLTGLGNSSLNLYVTVTDGTYTQKTGVWVVILDSKNPDNSDAASGGRPKFDIPLQMRPPGFPLEPPPNLGRPPIPPLPPKPPPLPTQPPPPIAEAKETTKKPGTDGSRSNTTSSTTFSTAENQNTSPQPAAGPKLKNPPQPPKPEHAPPSPPTPPSPSPPYPNVYPPPPHPNITDIALTVIPVTMVTIAFSVVVIAAFLFRRRICGSTKKKKKKKASKKDDMTKKSSSGLGGEEPMVLQHWRGPRALSNRYTAWDPDGTSPAMPQTDAPSVPLFKPKDKWEFPRHQLKVFNILGEGCFGQVWKCEARDIIEGEPGPKIVAVKTLKENAGEREMSDLVSELQILKMLEPHPNVVRLLGCCTEKDPIFVIMEYVANGKLQSFLRSSRASRFYDNMHGKSNSLTSRQLTSFCYQVARGMEFLSSKGIIHRDLAARNVLVDTDHTCKVADFGFARDVVASHVYERKSEGRLPIRWMAPESLYDNVFSVKSDVWSFGVLIWEIVTLGSTPYPGLSAMEVMKRVKEGERLEKPEHCRRELYNIMYYCWDGEAGKRPDFTELVDLLGQLLLSETEYIELQRFPDHSYYNMVSLSGEKV
ncbi:Tyrosine kinase receptor [Nesidiocoris tenuis]|uniref:Tyrosine kinase receptor n=1 Tax=Nesidiocoris tenuis TaxID=355587 RepID=A0ABN7AUW7_9HEMI|nr:Tyrosine kinase receptor [Nesidiocoris tenuis]